MDIDMKDYIGILGTQGEISVLSGGSFQPNVAYGWCYLWILPHPEGIAAEDLAFSLKN
jgi:hypothetical protein